MGNSYMPQIQMPIFPVGTTLITNELAFEKRENQVVYFNGHLPVFTHDVSDIASFRLFTTQLIINGTASQGDISRAFGISLTTIKRCVKRYYEHGASAFFVARPKREGKKLTDARLIEAQTLLDQGKNVPEISEQLGVLQTTLHKAISSGRLRKCINRPREITDHSPNDRASSDNTEDDNHYSHKAFNKNGYSDYRAICKSDIETPSEIIQPANVSTKSQRSEADCQGVFGVATLRKMDRIAAAIGAIESAPLRFDAVDDVPMGGVLCAIPALLSFGLLSHTRETFLLPKGFYPVETIFLVLALLALARVRSLESLRYQAPGEWGKLIGFDRIPEVKTMREKLDLLCEEPGRAQRWSSTLAKEWMSTSSEAAGTIYVDGHVRVYHGHLTKLPRRYVARERLLLRGTTDYWANAMDGQPFFVVTQAVDPGLLNVLHDDIIPRLKSDIPDQPTKEALDANPYLHRFTIVFDRAGYSPDFFKKMWAERIAVITYRKFTNEQNDNELWEDDEFKSCRVALFNGEEIDLDLAERGTRLSNGMWVREVRHRDKGGHQTSIIATDFVNSLCKIAAWMFARWCQENFFKYMLQHFGLDRLIEYGTEPLPDTTRVVNPAWRKLDGEVRKIAALMAKEKAKFGALHLPFEPEISDQETKIHETQKGQILLLIQEYQNELDKLKESRKATSKHIEIKDLPEQDRFSQLRNDKKHLIDTIKMIAYRAETALAKIAGEKLARVRDESRAWVRGLFQSSVDLMPDYEKKTLTVRIHRQATTAHDAVLDFVCNELTETECIYPGTNLRLIFQPIGSA
jgi:hypothetical protein